MTIVKTIKGMKDEGGRSGQYKILESVFREKKKTLMKGKKEPPSFLPCLPTFRKEKKILKFKMSTSSHLHEAEISSILMKKEYN